MARYNVRKSSQPLSKISPRTDSITITSYSYLNNPWFSSVLRDIKCKIINATSSNAENKLLNKTLPSDIFCKSNTTNISNMENNTKILNELLDLSINGKEKHFKLLNNTE